MFTYIIVFCMTGLLAWVAKCVRDCDKDYIEGYHYRKRAELAEDKLKKANQKLLEVGYED